MQTISDKDLEGLRFFLEETAVPGDLATFGPRLLPAINRLVPGDVVCHAEIDPVRAKVIRQTTYASGAEATSDRGTFEQYMMGHPVFQHWAGSGDTSPARVSDFLTLRQWHNSDLYQNVYQDWRCNDSMPIGLPAPAGFVACFCIERGKAFSDNELLLMRIVQPHLAQAYRNAEAFALLNQATASSGTYSALVDAKGQPVFASEAAWELISEYFPEQHASRKEFPGALAAWIWNQLSRFGSDHEVPPVAAPLILKKPDGRSLTLRILPGPTTGEQALVVLQEGQIGIPKDVPPELGLTAREEEVLIATMHGRTSTDIADQLYISRRTVEKHLEHIYDKLGVDSRTAAVAQAFFPQN